MNVAWGARTERLQRAFRWRRSLVVGGLMFVLFGIVMGGVYWKAARRQWLLSEVHAFRGTAVRNKPLWDRIQQWYQTGRFPDDRPMMVLLIDDRFDDAWIREHDYLRGLAIETLESHDITEDDLATLIEAHPLETLDLALSTLSNEAIAAIGRKSRLKTLNLTHTNLDDAGLAALPLEQLELLDVTATNVTADGLRELTRCQGLESVALGADQLTAETAQILASLGTVNRIWLAGVEITDTQLVHLQQVSSLRDLHLHQTRTTAEGRAAFAQALPACDIALSSVNGR